MSRAAVVCPLVSLAVLCVAVTVVDGLYPNVSPTPPVFPNAFSVSFNEVENILGRVLSTNNGTWHFDFANHRARFDHNKGQTNFFCDNQNLSPKDPKANCQLFFTPTDDLIVYYPGAQTCCRLCGQKEGCTILKPNWLQEDSRLISVEEINRLKCYGWAKQGAVAAADTWFATADSVPCRYHEVVYHIDHNLTFVPETYKIGPQDPSLFNVPSHCNKPCPHPYHPPR